MKIEFDPTTDDLDLVRRVLNVFGSEPVERPEFAPPISEPVKDPIAEAMALPRVPLSPTHEVFSELYTQLKEVMGGHKARSWFRGRFGTEPTKVAHLDQAEVDVALRAKLADEMGAHGTEEGEPPAEEVQEELPLESAPEPAPEPDLEADLPSEDDVIAVLNKASKGTDEQIEKVMEYMRDLKVQRGRDIPAEKRAGFIAKVEEILG